jgi:hypothetical protein
MEEALHALSEVGNLEDPQTLRLLQLVWVRQSSGCDWNCSSGRFWPGNALLLVIVELNADSRWSGSIYSRGFPVGHLTMPSLIFLLCCGVTFFT